MSGAWTPGPWTVGKGAGWFVKREGRRAALMVGMGPEYSIVSDGHVDHQSRDSEAEANAHLISAAPDLYAALDGLLAAYSEPDQQICCNGHECGCRGASVRDLAEHHARAALRKARGEA